MTTTPTVWLAEYTANSGSTTGSQFNPYTIGLADDRFLTVWTDDTGGTQAGYDVLGQIFNAQGTPVGGAFQINSGFFADNESLGSIAALPDGGFVMAFVDDENTGSGQPVIRVQRYDANGVSTFTTSISPAGNPVSDPEITVGPNGSYMVSFTRTIAGDIDVRGVIISSTNVVGAEFDAGQNSSDRDADSDVAGLSNGSFATAYEEDDAGVTGIEVQIVNSSGGVLNNIQVFSTAASDPHITALTGGGLAVVWNDSANGGDIRFSIFTDAGGSVASSILVAGGANSQNEPKVIGLSDGGFFVVWDDDTSDQLIGQRYSATGTAIGSNLPIANTVTEPELGLTDDGRILVTFSNAAGEISEVILDPRDNVIVGDSSNEVITSRIDGASVDGGIGVDTLLGQAGNDTLYGGFSTDSVSGGGGNDLIVVRDGEFGDNTDGGADVDTLDFSNLTNFSVVLDMAAGNYTLRDTGNIQFGDVNSLLNVENVNGSQRGDFISAGGVDLVDNVFNGNGGNDTLEGGYNGDKLNGGAGNDVIFAMTQANPEDSGVGDTIDGGADNDSIVGSAGFDSITGGLGMDTMNGGTGADTMIGGAGNDFYVVDNVGDVVTEGAAAGTDVVNTTLATYTLTANVDRLYFDDGTINHVGRGNALANRLYGNDGDDRFIIDSSGGDTYAGGNGVDVFDGRSSATGMVLHLDNQALNAGSIADDLFGQIERFTGSLTAGDNMTMGAAGRAYFVGNGGNDTLTGGSNVDALYGGDGADRLFGLAGKDALQGGAGNDTMTGGADRDYFQFVESNFGADRITDWQDGTDLLKVLSTVADNITDFGIAGNGTTHVVLTLSAGNTITLDSAAAINITAADFVFY